ncbi:MAG: flavin monoamine oxidase family protein [Conexibacter sp.]
MLGRPMSRRDLMRKAGAASASLTAASLVGRIPMAKADPTLPSVVVIGAGLAGTTAAYRLMQAGFPVSLYESRNRVGGRCWSLHELPGSQVAEHGGELIDSDHVHLLGLASELRLTLEDYFTPTGVAPTWPCYIDGRWYPQSAFDAEFEQLGSAIVAQAQSIGAVSGQSLNDAAYSWGTATSGAIALDQMSMRDWMDAKLPGMTSTPFGRLMERVISGGSGIPMAQSSAIGLIEWWLTPEPRDVERYHIRGGNDQVPRMCAAALPAGALHLEAPLQRLSRLSNGTYEMAFGGISSVVRADRVILALPFSTLRDVDLTRAGFGSHRLDVVNQLGMGTNAKMMLQYNDRPQAHTIPVYPNTWNGNCADMDDGFQCWESTRDQPGTGSIITLFYGGANAPNWGSTRPAHAFANGSIVNNRVSHLETTVPGTGSHFTGNAWLDVWANDPWTKGSYSAYKLGQYTAAYRFNYLPEGGVHFAGEHTSTLSHAYLNGGVESGQRTAIELMREAGVRVPPAIANLPYSTD